MFQLRCAVQTYDWGKIGPASAVYDLVKNWSKQPQLDESKPYAELWMGTHPSGPSLIGPSGKDLASYLQQHKSAVGPGLLKQFGANLPFLFKVLSIRKALSIQAHPNKTHAEQLHKDHPDLYKDANHKPELAIALTEFEALLAFRPVVEISTFVKEIPELKQCIGFEAADELALAAQHHDDHSMVCDAIKMAYSNLMREASEKVGTLVEALKQRLRKSNPASLISPPVFDSDKLAQLFVRLATDFPADVGCFSIFFLNYLHLRPGEAIFLEANLPHAYLSGDCIECMACSDNVVRAGLTPKHKDVNCLLQMLQYSPRTMGSLRFDGTLRSAPLPPLSTLPLPAKTSSYPEIVSYMPPVKDFAVDKIVVPISYTSFQLCPVASASILLIVHGSGRMQRMTPLDSSIDTGDVAATELLDFKRGSVFFISSGVSVCFHQLGSESGHTTAATADHLLAFRAYGNVDFLI